MRPTRRLATVLAVPSLLFTISCADSATPNEPSPSLRVEDPSGTTAAMQAFGADANLALEARGSDVRIGAIEWITADDAGEEGGTVVYFNDRGNKEVAVHFVPGDPRRGGRTNITYLVDKSGDSNDPTAAGQTEAAIDRAMATWDAVSCSDLNMTKKVDTGADPDIMDELQPSFPDDGTGGVLAADIVHAGWLPTGLPVGVLAVTFTFVFTGPGGATDIDNNKRADAAWKEIYYNDRYIWRINGNVDVETVALHEAGHGLGQAHFGKAFATVSNNKLHFAPRAVMNAGYSGIQQELAGTDNGGHCTNWGSWPHR